jgi:hypothetical protein
MPSARGSEGKEIAAEVARGFYNELQLQDTSLMPGIYPGHGVWRFVT